MHITDHTETIDACRFCFMCRHVCTVGILSGRESDTPRGRALILSKIKRGHIAYSEELIETVYRCCLCGLCETWCQAKMRPTAAALAARADIVAAGMAPERVRELRDHLLADANPFGLARGDRFQKIDGCVFVERPEVLYYIGADAAYKRPEIANAFISILKSANVGFSVLQGEGETGKSLAALGYIDDARAAATGLLEQIRSTGCTAIVTTCPSAFDAFTSDYPSMGLDMGGIEVLHAVQYVDRLIAEKRISPRKHIAKTATLLDGTYLGRTHGIYDAPRRVLDSVLATERREMSWSKELAHSAGEAAGIFGLLHPALGSAMANRVLDEAARSGADILATTCPATKTALLAARRDGIEIRDIVELVAGGL